MSSATETLQPLIKEVYLVQFGEEEPYKGEQKDLAEANGKYTEL